MGLKVHHLPLGDEAGPSPAPWALHGVDLERDVEKRPFGWQDDLDFGETRMAGLRSPLTMWYIEGADLKVVVDTGCDTNATSRVNAREAGEKAGFSLWTNHRDEWTVEAQLARFGVEPDDIDVVVNTCLHFDHIGNNTRFRNARFYIQARELPYGLDPPPWAQFYYPEFAYNIEEVRDRLEVLDGDRLITEGVRVVRLGGHTPGTQVVLVETDEGRVCLPGDMIPFYKNLELNWPTGAFFNLTELIEGYQWMHDNADLILPHHDWEFFERHPTGSVG